MSGYTETLTITLPYSEEMARIAALIGKAMDPDSGGDASFARPTIGFDGETPVYGDTLRCHTPVKPFFKEQAFAMLQNAAFLHAACAQDYATRWPDLTPPTLADCETFCDVVVLE